MPTREILMWSRMGDVCFLHIQNKNMRIAISVTLCKCLLISFYTPTVCIWPAMAPLLVESAVPHLYRIWSSPRFRIPTTLGRDCNSASLPYLDFYSYKIVDPQWLRFWSSLRFRIPSAFSRALQWGDLFYFTPIYIGFL